MMPLFRERAALPVWRVAIVVTAIVVVLLLARQAGLFAISDRAQLVAWIARVREAPFLMPAFVAGYAVCAAAGVPATPLTLAGGILFGALWGTLVNWIAEMGAALIAFGALRFAGLSRRAAPLNARTLFRLRLIPVVPFALLNAGAAASTMSWPAFAGATALGIVPVTVIYTVSAAQLVAGIAGSGMRALITACISAGVIILLSFVPELWPRLRPVRESG